LGGRASLWLALGIVLISTSKKALYQLLKDKSFSPLADRSCGSALAEGAGCPFSVTGIILISTGIPQLGYCVPLSFQSLAEPTEGRAEHPLGGLTGIVLISTINVYHKTIAANKLFQSPDGDCFNFYEIHIPKGSMINSIVSVP
jgi:hypothetical protein